MQFKHFLLPIVFCLLTCSSYGSTRLGIWAWKQTHFTTAQSRSQMLDFCKQENISHIDQHISIKNGEIENAQALKKLVIEATKQNITINALRGSKEMFFATNHQRTMGDLKLMVKFNHSLPRNSKLLGIKFDVEPYLTPEWKAGGNQKEKVMLDYLNFLTQANTHLKQHAKGLELSVDVPFWWDKKEHALTFKGQTKPLVHHIQDNVSWIGIMSYRRDPDTTTKLIQDEINYAKKENLPRSVAAGMETTKLSGKEAHISFGGVPPKQFRKALKKLSANLANNPHIRCIMIHHYGGLKSYLNSTGKGQP